MRERPGCYFGKKSLLELDAFLMGYVACYHENCESLETLEYLPGFNRFVAAYFNVNTQERWSNIISRNTANEEEAFDKFFELLDSFYGKWYIY